jgi:hypothetical protein
MSVSKNEGIDRSISADIKTIGRRNQGLEVA